MWSPPLPLPFWNKLTPGGKEQFSRLIEGKVPPFHIPPRQSSTGPHRVTLGEKWPSCSSLHSLEGGVGFLTSSTIPCISTGIIYILMAILGPRALVFIVVYLILLYQICQMMPSRLYFLVNYHVRFMNEQKTSTHMHKRKPMLRDSRWLFFSFRYRAKIQSQVSWLQLLDSFHCSLVSNKRYKNFSELYLILQTPGCRWEAGQMISRVTSREIALQRYLTVTQRMTGIPKLHFVMTSPSTEEPGMLRSTGSQRAGRN